MIEMRILTLVVWLNLVSVSLIYIINYSSIVLNQIFESFKSCTLRNIKSCKLKRDLPCGTFPNKGRVRVNMFFLALLLKDFPSFKGVIRSIGKALIV